jgi:hypothetical protein
MNTITILQNGNWQVPNPREQRARGEKTDYFVTNQYITMADLFDIAKGYTRFLLLLLLPPLPNQTAAASSARGAPVFSSHACVRARHRPPPRRLQGSIVCARHAQLRSVQRVDGANLLYPWPLPAWARNLHLHLPWLPRRRLEVPLKPPPRLLDVHDLHRCAKCRDSWSRADSRRP